MNPLAILAFIRSPVGKYLLIGLAVLALVWTIYGKGRGDGAAHEHAAMQKRIDIVQGDLTRCQANGKALQSSIERQNAAVTAIQQVSDRKMAEAAQALSLASRGRVSAEARAAKLLARPPAGIDACARMESADAAVMEALK